MASCPIDEKKRTAWPLAGLHIVEVLSADEVCKQYGEWEKQRFR
jgi:hypothetical protein